jgi:hypothetical protein
MSVGLVDELDVGRAIGHSRQRRLLGPALPAPVTNRIGHSSSLLK